MRSFPAFSFRYFQLSIFIMKHVNGVKIEYSCLYRKCLPYIVMFADANISRYFESVTSDQVFNLERIMHGLHDFFSGGNIISLSVSLRFFPITCVDLVVRPKSIKTYFPRQNETVGLLFFFPIFAAFFTAITMALFIDRRKTRNLLHFFISFSGLFSFFGA